MFDLYQLSEEIRSRRIELGWTQLDLGKAARVSRATIARIETANFNDIGFLKLLRILNVLGLTLKIEEIPKIPTLNDLYQKKKQRKL